MVATAFSVIPVQPRRVDAPVRSFRVRVLAGPDVGREISVSDACLIVGTGKDAGLALSDPDVARSHLELRLTERGVLVRDLGACGGTRVAGHLVRELVARETLDIEIGRTRLRLHLGGGVADASRFGGLVGVSHAMRALFATLELAAPSRAPVLIIGESGTGKELAARALHARSPRAHARFEVVDCASLSPSLLEAELFGRESAGALERACGGTLFLDRLSWLPLPLQAKLARVLGDQQVRRIGDTATRSIDLLVVSATDHDPSDDIATESFRSDLYYRLAVVKVRIPALRQRVDDLSLLLSALTREIDAGAEPPSWEIDRMREYAWPGNVRELRNYVEESLVLGAPAHLPDTMRDALTLPLHVALSQFERDYISDLLVATGGNVARTARYAGVSRATMFRMITKHGIR